MIPHLMVITPNRVDEEPNCVDHIIQLSTDPRITLLIREPAATEQTLGSLRLALKNAKAQIICHTKTPGFEHWLNDIPNCGLHLPAAGHIPQWVNQVSGPLGQSTHSLESAQKAFSSGANYITLSPVFPPRSKIQDSRPLVTHDVLKRAGALGPTLALGGINAQRFQQLRREGVWGGAVLGSVFLDKEPLSSFF